MFEVINQAWLLTITSPTTACSPTVKAREIHSATPAACTVRHILLLLHFLTERVTGCQMKCSLGSGKAQPVNHRHPLLRVLTSAGNHDGIEGLARVNLMQTMVGQQI